MARPVGLTIPDDAEVDAIYQAAIDDARGDQRIGVDDLLKKTRERPLDQREGMLLDREVRSLQTRSRGSTRGHGQGGAAKRGAATPAVLHQKEMDLPHTSCTAVAILVGGYALIFFTHYLWVTHQQ